MYDSWLVQLNSASPLRMAISLVPETALLAWKSLDESGCLRHFYVRLQIDTESALVTVVRMHFQFLSSSATDSSCSGRDRHFGSQDHPGPVKVHKGSLEGSRKSCRPLGLRRRTIRAGDLLRRAWSEGTGWIVKRSSGGTKKGRYIGSAI